MSDITKQQLEDIITKRISKTIDSEHRVLLHYLAMFLNHFDLIKKIFVQEIETNKDDYKKLIRFCNIAYDLIDNDGNNDRKNQNKKELNAILRKCCECFGLIDGKDDAKVEKSINSLKQIIENSFSKKYITNANKEELIKLLDKPSLEMSDSQSGLQELLSFFIRNERSMIELMIEQDDIPSSEFERRKNELQSAAKQFYIVQYAKIQSLKSKISIP